MSITDGARPLVGQRETGRENSRGSFSWLLMVCVYLARKDQQNQCMVSTRLIYLTGLISFDGPEFTKPGIPWCHFLGPTVAVCWDPFLYLWSFTIIAPRITVLEGILGYH